MVTEVPMCKGDAPFTSSTLGDKWCNSSIMAKFPANTAAWRADLWWISCPNIGYFH